MQAEESKSRIKQRKTAVRSIPRASTFADAEIASLFLETIPFAMQEIRVEMRESRSVDLTVSQFRVLANLWIEPTNNSMLADNLGLSVAATSRMLDWLIKRKLVERVANTSDRRQIIVQLTPQGKRSFESNQKRTRLQFEKRIQKLSLINKQNLAQGLLALKTAVEEMA